MAMPKNNYNDNKVDTVFVLYGGTSCDGRGNPEYVTFTTDESVAMEHYNECKRNPYSIGRVEILTRGEKRIMSDFW